MTIQRTHDSILLVGTSGAAFELTNILGWTITGSTTTESLRVARQEANEAAVHAVGNAVGFSTVYETAEFRKAVTGILGTRLASNRDGYFCRINPNPVAWEMVPVDYSVPSRNAPGAGSIVRPWSMTGRDRKMWGTTYAAFQNVGASPSSIGQSLDGTSVDTAVLAVVLTKVAASVTAIQLRDGSTNHALNASVGIQIVDDKVAAGAVTIAATGGEIDGYVLIGRKEVLPSG